MKRFLCICSEILSIIFFAFWILMFFVVPRLEQLTPINILMVTNLVIIGATLILGCTYFNMTIDQFFSWYSNDSLPIKEKILIMIEVWITGICALTFVFMILQHNLQNQDLNVWEDARLKILGLIIANAWVWYASYQTYHSVNKI